MVQAQYVHLRGVPQLRQSRQHCSKARQQLEQVNQQLKGEPAMDAPSIMLESTETKVSPLLDTE